LQITTIEDQRRALALRKNVGREILLSHKDSPRDVSAIPKRRTVAVEDEAIELVHTHAQLARRQRRYPERANVESVKPSKIRRQNSANLWRCSRWEAGSMLIACKST
jgi:hypothetical protein